MITTRDLENSPSPAPSLGDNLEQRYALNFGESTLALARSAGAHTLEMPGLIAVDYGVPAGYLNAAVLTEPPTGDMIPTIEDFYANGSGTAEIFSPWPLGDLSASGWELEGHPPFMVRPPAPGAPARASDLDIRLVTDEAALRHWERVVIAGFPFPDATPGSLVGPAVLDDDRLRMWVGYEVDTPVSIATSFADQGVVAFMLGVTIPEARGRGYWYAMAATRIAAYPDATFVSINSDDSQVGARNLGFLPVTRWHVVKKHRP